MGRPKRISDLALSEKRIKIAYEKNKKQIDFIKITHQLAFYQNRINECEPAIYGERVQKLRTERKVSQKTFAEQIGTTTATLSKIENGHVRSINTDLMYNICGIYNTNPSYLIGETLDPTVYKKIDLITGAETYEIESLNYYPKTVFDLYWELQAANDKHLPEISVKEIGREFQENAEICKLMLTILQSNDSALKEQVTNVLRGLVQSAEYHWSQGG